MGVDAKSLKTCLVGLAAGGGLALLSQMGFVPSPSVIAPSGGGLALTSGGTADAGQEARPANFDAYEVPSFMNAVYEGRYDQTGFDRLRRLGFIVHMATVIRQTCRGPFSTAQIARWESELEDEVLGMVSVETGFKVLEQQARIMKDFIEDPRRLKNYDDGMPSPEEVPMKAQQDGMSFVQEHQCNGPVFERFTANLAEAAQTRDPPPNEPR